MKCIIIGNVSIVCEVAALDSAKGNGVRLRAIILGIGLLWLSCEWIFEGEMARYTFATWAVPFYNAVYILLVLTLANLWVNKRWPSLALRRLELLAIYSMVSIGSALISSDMQGMLITIMGYSTFFAERIGSEHEAVSASLPHWLIVDDKAVLRGFYEGQASFYSPDILRAWIKPIIPWTLFLWAMLFMMACVDTILRKAWVEKERLTFPIVALPVAMTAEPEKFFKNRLLWIGFAIAGTITLINGLNYLFPTVPFIPIKKQLFRFTTGGPIDAIGDIRIELYFFALAIGFLIPLDLSFSLYFFYIAFKLQRVVTFMMGMGGDDLYGWSQNFGAYMAIFVMAVWGLRSHLRVVWRTAFSDKKSDTDANEPMRYRTAIIGFGVCSFFLLVFAIAAGMKPWVAFIFFAVYLALSVVITRMRAEFGFPVHDMKRIAADDTLTRLVTPQSFDQHTLGAMTMFSWFTRYMRSHPMPHMLESMKMAGGERESQRSMFRAVMIAGMLAVPICFIIYLNGFYTRGAATGLMNGTAMLNGNWTFGRLADWLGETNEIDLGETWGALFGFSFAMVLAFLRRRFAGFPFHPLGYAVANGWGIANMYFPIMIGSWCKAIVLRIAGLEGYRKAIMFFFGLVLGEFFVGCSWTLIGMLLGIPTYDFWP